MELKEKLLAEIKDKEIEYGDATYEESVIPEAETDAWLEAGTSYIWKVGVLAVIDSNKCDWATVVIGILRGPQSNPEVIGQLHFPQGENDDMGRVMDRVMKLLPMIHPAFNP